MADEILSNRAMNRALLERQGLLSRSETPALEMVERVVSLQAQVPENPYVALWARIAGFDPHELSDAVADRAAVRGHLIRPTIHLVTARDCLAHQPLAAPVLDKALHAPFGRQLVAGGVDLDELTRAGRALLDERPHTLRDLGARLSVRWPHADPTALSSMAAARNRVLQIPPRGLWRRSGAATWTPTDSWLGAPLDTEPSVEEVVHRYLRAFGPATPGDMRTWSKMTDLGPVFERMRPELRTFRDERGRELFDVPGGALPDPDTPAPPRLLPQFDNVLLSHEDRSRVFDTHTPTTPPATGKWTGTLLVDGFYRANWKLAEADSTATLTIDPFRRRRTDPPGTRDAIRAETTALLALIAPDAKPRVAFAR